MKLPPYFSASSLKTYDTCPYQWWLKYIKKLEQLPNDAFIIGTAYHESLELLHGGMDRDEVMEQIKKQFTGSLTGITQFGLIRTLFNKYCQNRVDFPTVEREYKFDFIDETTGLRFLGYIDRVVENGLVEYKTSSFDYKDKDINMIQVVLYAIAHKQKFGYLPGNVFLSVMNKKKAHKDSYKPQLLPLSVGEEDIDQFYLKATMIADKITKDKFPPIKGPHCYYCPFGRKGLGNCKYSL